MSRVVGEMAPLTGYNAKFEFEVPDYGRIEETMALFHDLDEEDLRDMLHDAIIDMMYKRDMCSSLFRYISLVTNTKRHILGGEWWYKLVYSIEALTTTPSSVVGGAPLTLQDKVFLLDQVQIVLNAIKSARVNMQELVEDGEDAKPSDEVRFCATMPDTIKFHRICSFLAVSYSKPNKNRYDVAHKKSFKESSSEEDSSEDNSSSDDEGEELGETSSEEEDSDDDSEDEEGDGDSDDDSVVSNDDPNSVTNADAPSEIGNTEDEADEADEEPAESPAKKPRLMRENVQDEEDEFEDEEEA